MLFDFTVVLKRMNGMNMNKKQFQNATERGLYNNNKLKVWFLLSAYTPYCVRIPMRHILPVCHRYFDPTIAIA
jgi:hypothetical protein